MNTTIPSTPVGEYVARAHPATHVGTYTGAPAATRGSYVSGISASRPAGRYEQRESRQTHTNTAAIRLHRGLATGH